MKKIFLFFVLSLISTSIFAQIKITPYFDGYWGNWNTSSFKIRGSYSGFMFYNETQGPWDCYFKFSIDNYRLPDSKQRKSDYKLGIWYEFTGTVEYYICDDYLLHNFSSECLPDYSFLGYSKKEILETAKKIVQERDLLISSDYQKSL